MTTRSGPVDVVAAHVARRQARDVTAADRNPVPAALRRELDRLAALERQGLLTPDEAALARDKLLGR